MSEPEKAKEEVKVETAGHPLISKGNEELAVNLTISRGEDSSLHIFIQSKLVADIVRKMAPGNYERENVAEIYHPILAPILKADNTPDTTEAAKKRFRTRPAISKASTLFAQTTEFSFTDKPSTILLSNPDALEEGYTLIYKVEAPVPMDTLKRWGKNLMDGCTEIITNAKPFKMSWLMERVE